MGKAAPNERSATLSMNRAKPSGGGTGALDRAHVCRDEISHCLLVARAQELDRVGLRVHDGLEEDLAVLVGRERLPGPAADVVEQLREYRVGLAVALRDLGAQPLGERR